MLQRQKLAIGLLAHQHRVQVAAGQVGLETCEKVDEPAAERALEQVIDRQDLALEFLRLGAVLR